MDFLVLYYHGQDTSEGLQIDHINPPLIYPNSSKLLGKECESPIIQWQERRCVFKWLLI